MLLDLYPLFAAAPAHVPPRPPFGLARRLPDDELALVALVLTLS